ncbi:MAG: pilus assembly PilX family protein [Candidatus Aminicenantia bacterium]
MKEKGIALLTTLVVMVFMLIIGALTLYISVVSMRVSGIAKGYLTAFEAAESGVEEAISKILTTQAPITDENERKIIRGTKVMGEDYKIETEIVFFNVSNLPGGAGPVFPPETAKYGRNCIIYRIDSRAYSLRERKSVAEEGFSEHTSYTYKPMTTLSCIYIKVM